MRDKNIKAKIVKIEGTDTPKGYTSSDFRGLVAVGRNLDLNVLAVTDDCHMADMFINGFGPDDNNLVARERLDVGLYHVTFKDRSDEGYDGLEMWVIEKYGKPPAEFSAYNDNVSEDKEDMADLGECMYNALYMITQRLLNLTMKVGYNERDEEYTRGQVISNAEHILLRASRHYSKKGIEHGDS